MSKPIHWSFSALEMFETCPRQYYEVKIRKSVKQEHFASSKGAMQHKEVENYLLRGVTPTYPEVVDNMRVIKYFSEMPGKVYTEHKMALTPDYKVCDFMDWNNTWLRAISDLTVVDGDRATIVDWKFGKPRDGDDQIKLTAATAFAHFPRVNTIQGVYVYMTAKLASPTYVYHRADAPEIWRGFAVRYSALEKQARLGNEGDWSPRPSGLCRKHCSVISCEFNGGYVR